VAFEPARERELQQHHAHDRRRGAGQPHQVVDPDRGRSEQADDAFALRGFGLVRVWRPIR
jgi:hypothetical protein